MRMTPPSTNASVMGQLRSALRAYTVADSPPATAMGLVSKLLTLVEPEAMATVCHLIVDVADDSDAGVTLHWASAGHPLPLIVEDDGNVRFLTGDVGPPVVEAAPVAAVAGQRGGAAVQFGLEQSDHGLGHRVVG
jgi:hypothetical protein